MKKLLILFSTVLMFGGAIAQESSAQHFGRRHTPRPLRWLGQGFGDGYQRCYPGYDSSYYNPYSAHNSMLISQTPEYLQLKHTQNFAMSSYHQPRQFFSGIPYSVYAAPPRRNPFAMPDNSMQNTIEPSFEPVKEDKEEELKEEKANRSLDDIDPKGLDDDTAFHLPTLNGNTRPFYVAPEKNQFRPASFRKK